MVPLFTTPVLAALSLKEMLVNAISSLLFGGAAQMGTQVVMQTALNIMTFQQTDADIISMALAVTAPIGFLLMVANFLAGWGKANMRDHEDGLQSFVRAGIWLLIADYALIHLADLAGVILSLSGSFGNTMKANMNMNADTMSNALSGISGFSIFALCVALIISVFGWAAQLIATLITVVICLSAKIEVMLRLAFCPIGIAFIADSEQNREGMRYLKKLLASGFYCGAILLALYIANMTNIGSIISSSSTAGTGSAEDIIGSIISTVETVFVVQLAAPLAAIGSISVAKSMLNEAFGA